jgi:hypothetical protein
MDSGFGQVRLSGGSASGRFHCAEVPLQTGSVILMGWFHCIEVSYTNNVFGE